MAMGSKGGRPPKPARLKRTRRLQLMLTEQEYRALSSLAARKQTTTSEIVRGALRPLLEEGGKL